MEYFVVKFTLNAASDDLREVASDLLASMAGEIGFESFEQTEEGLDGYVERSLFAEESLRQMVADFPFPGVDILYKVEKVEQRDWNAAWEQTGFEPIRVGQRCLIYDPRHDLPVGVVEKDFDVVVKIAPRMAFGSGTHETTQMLVEEMTNRRLTGLRVLDCGCGTGILSIAALKLGADEAWAYDIDEWSVENTRDNAALNGVTVNVLHGDVSVLGQVDGAFDLIVANINRNILLADMPAFVGKLATHGELWLSGFYEADVPMLKEKARELGLEVRQQRAKGDWCALMLVR